jgi:hypothetical protein
MNLGLEQSSDSDNVDFYWAETKDFYDCNGSGWDTAPRSHKGGTSVLEPRSLLVLKAAKDEYV